VAVAGTPFTFQLFSDSVCTALVQSQIAPVDAVDLVQLRLLKPRGGGSVPKAAEIRHTLIGVPAVAPLYLKVSGTGVLALGSDCQPQPITSAGSAPPPPPAGVLVVKDANDTVVGNFIGTSSGSGDVARIVAGRAVHLRVFNQGTPSISGDSLLAFGDSTCSTPPLGLFDLSVVSSDVFPNVQIIGQTLYYPVGPTAPQNAQAFLVDYGDCVLNQNIPNPIPVAPFATEDIGLLTPPFRVTTP